MKYWIERFAAHKIAANGLMVVIALSGIWGLGKISNQFFPDFDFDAVRVEVNWAGVAAEDIYEALGVPIQQALVNLPEIDSSNTVARNDGLSLWLRVSDRVDSPEALADLVAETLDGVDLPDDADEPDISIPKRRESVADVLLYGEVPLDELGGLASNLEQQLLSAGLVQVDISGVESASIDVIVPVERLLETGQTLATIANTLENAYLPQPGGTTETNPVTLQLRSQTTQIDLTSLYDTVIAPLGNNGALRLGDIATIARVSAQNSEAIFFENHPAIRLQVRRAVGEDTLVNAELMNEVLANFEQTLPPSVQLHLYNQTWQIVADQLTLLTGNGLLGMALVLIALFLFLNARLALWVAVGIPISFLATFLFMSFTDSTLNTISLFAFMIALGIIVDDAIVVGEQARTFQQQGLDPKTAAIRAAQKMWTPILASSLTTIAAFIPLLYISGPIGRLSADIPVIVTIAIIASLIECFLILPGHLSHTQAREDGKWRKKLDAGFNRLRDGYFRPLVRWTLNNRIILIAILVGNLFIAMSLLTTRTVPFQFQPAVESPSLSVSVTFAEGVNPNKVTDFSSHLLTQLFSVEETTGYSFIKTAVVTQNQSDSPNRARINVELISDQNRPYTNQELVSEWRKAVTLPSEIESINFGRGRRWGGESGDINIRIAGNDVALLKTASTDLQNRLKSIAALSDPTDDLPLGDEQLRFERSTLALELGISEAVIAEQLRQGLYGVNAGTQVNGLETLDVTVKYPNSQSETLGQLLSIPLPQSSGELIPLDDLMDVEYTRGLDSINAENGELATTVSATLDDTLMTTDDMYRLLESEVIPSFQAEYGTLLVTLSGDAEDQDQFFNETLLILLAVIALIYGILAWVFESWVWPLAVLVTIPFGLIGGIYGHWIIDLPLSALSVLGLFGLAGIVVNDSIVLVTVYRELRQEGLAIRQALEDAVAQRLRPVLLTSITTMAGLTPLLFETSLDAQFLKPIAAGLVFGLLMGTVLILLLVPSVLLAIEQLSERSTALKKRLFSFGK